MLHFLVTGSKGQLSRSLIERSPFHKARVSTCGLPLINFALPAKIIFDKIIEQFQSQNINFIINAAAYTAVDKAEDEPDKAMAVNAHAAEALANVAAYLDIPIIHISTDYVFNGQKSSPWNESDQTDPINVYGTTKCLGEILVQNACTHHIILRTSWVYSPFGNNFVKTMLHLSEKYDELKVVKDQTGSPTSALDLADALFSIGNQMYQNKTDASLYGTYHITGTGCISWAEFAQTIFKEASLRGVKPVNIVGIDSSDYPSKAQRPSYSCLNTDKLFHNFGIRLPPWQLSLKSTLDRLINPI